jgi:hypothetical protein
LVQGGKVAGGNSELNPPGMRPTQKKGNIKLELACMPPQAKEVENPFIKTIFINFLDTCTTMPLGL